VELYKKTAHELLDMLRSGEINPEDAVKSVFERIHKQEKNIKAYITLLEEQAMAQARKLKDADRSLPLYGIPIAIKDNMCTEGVQTSCGSKILIPYKPPYDATIVRKIKEAGAVIVGKTNMDEFAMGSSCEHSAFFPTHNPWDFERVPGGSSGGSAAAVAAGECILSTGSDTGGSIRQPASLCGVVGLKPTYGRVSRFGLVAFASSLDQIGPFTKDVRDCALFLNVLAGYDPADSTSVDCKTPDYTLCLTGNVKGMKIGVVKELLGEGIEDPIRASVLKAIEKFKELGAEIVNVELPSTKYALTAYYLIAPAEASSNLARYDGVQYGLRVKANDIISMFCKTRKEGFGDEVKRRIMLGNYALSAGYYDAYYLRALKVRTLIVKDFERAFSQCDIMLSPTAPSTAFKIGEKTDDPLSMYMNDICTIPVNLAGLPGISIPCGLSEGLPIGLHIFGRPFGEEEVLRAAHAFEQNTDLIRCPLA
jgi:aspartyl-tRNA(Asn)/glutamyl-tRNA(Gln) amidotransferase subunit A